MKPVTLACMIAVLTVCLLLTAALGEGSPDIQFFPDTTYRHISCSTPGNSLSFDTVFYADGSYWGFDKALDVVYGYYLLMPSGEMRLDVDCDEFFLTPGKNGSYTGAMADGAGSCNVTTIKKKTFTALAKKAGLDFAVDFSRMDINEWDYPIYEIVAQPEGINLLLNWRWPETAVSHLPQGTLVLILGDDDGGLLVEANGIRGFVEDKDDIFTYVPVMKARVVRSSDQDKGRSVNLRKTPEYGSNVHCEVPYGEIVDVFPVSVGEFTKVYYDHGDGWMTTIRLELLDEDQWQEAE